MRVSFGAFLFLLSIILSSVSLYTALSERWNAVRYQQAYESAKAHVESMSRTKWKAINPAYRCVALHQTDLE